MTGQKALLNTTLNKPSEKEIVGGEDEGGNVTESDASL
jgi:hypothetical protein